MARPLPTQERGSGEIDARRGRKSSDKEDILAADRFGLRGLDFEDSQRKPRH
ncbi:MAG TPA: hypothetical protein VFJ60_01435 [Gaiella sp.]|nr:hypothetical protein [Gaiella sp.]